MAEPEKAEKKAEKKTEKKPAAKGGAGKAKKKDRWLSSLYLISGEKIQRQNKSCHKCGAGVFMARHKDRAVCGKCRYAEFGKK